MLESKRILFVLHGLELGGAERQALQLARYFRDNGNSVYVMGFQVPGRAAEICDDLRIPWGVVETPWLSPRRLHRLASLIKFARQLLLQKPDIILSYLSHPNLVCGLAWRFSGAKLLIWNQRDAGLGHIPGRKAELLAARLTPRFIANSQVGVDFLQGELGVDAEKIIIIHNGIQLPLPLFDRSGWRQKIGVDDDVFLACMVANLTEYKDHLTLLHAWRLVLDKLSTMNHPAKLLLAGRLGSTTDGVKAKILDLKLWNDVQILGSVDDIAGLLSAVDLCVFSSRSEGCPNGVLESMAAGLPVVATDVPGIRDALGTDVPLSPPGSSDVFAKQVLDFALDREARLNAGAKNKFRVEREFGLPKMLAETEDVIAQGLDGH
ncbi:MAG: glycosyltransferase [Anaerolineales bacterium]|nr:glycosyltransferase [Anaerolineales bacterium]